MNNLPAQITSKFVVAVDGCWVWQKSITGGGYGYITWKRKTQKAVRLIYELLIGPIPTGLQLDHLCRNRACVNPYHVEPVTNRENTMRGAIGQKTQCDYGHPFDDSNTGRTKQGHRYCKACHSQKENARHHRVKVLHPKNEHTHCAKGHEYTPESTGTASTGNRFCRICRNNWQRASRAQRRLT